jgi:GNAT superfamily N-acetyltransferase
VTDESDRADVEIRTQPADAPDVVRLLALADAKDLRDSLPAGQRPPDRAGPRPDLGGIFLVAYVNGQPSGCGGYRVFAADPTGRTAEIAQMYVRPDSRRTGLARSILAELERLAADDRYQRVAVRIGDQQRAAHALYEITGYRALAGSESGGAIYVKSLAHGPGDGADFDPGSDAEGEPI